ncbi:MAG: alpha/beta fold hydrolase [Candidatus Nomurabacteria bacterium]
MVKLKYIFILLIFFSFINKTEAVDIRYGSILGYKANDVLIQYYGIGKKNNYICNIINYKCVATKKTALGKYIATTLNPNIKKELLDSKGGRLTYSKQGNWLAYYIRSQEPENKRTFVIKDIKNNINYTTSSGVDYWDLVNEEKKVFEFSPDEKSLVYMDDKDGTMSLYKVDLNSLKNGKIESIKIESAAFTIANFVYDDSQNIYFVGNSKDNPYKWSLYHLDFKTGKENIVETYVSYVDSIGKIGTQLIFNRLQAKGYGPEMYNIKTKKINTFKVPGISTKVNILHEEYTKVGSSNAVIMTPTTYNPNKTYPVLIWLHGGPLRQTSLGYHPYHSYGIYDASLKLLQKNNVIVLKLDYSGSFGSGRAYSEKIKDNVGVQDMKDLMEAVSFLKNQYNISDIYLSGNSYGGYMALKAVVEHGDIFKSVTSINGVTDWESLLVRMKNSIFNKDFNGLPNSSNQNLYDQASIISKINNLSNQKIEIIQGGSDSTIPPWQSVLLYDKLKAANKNVNLTTYKGEDHVFKFKKNIDNICVKLMQMVGVKNTKECTS